MHPDLVYIQKCRDTERRLAFAAICAGIIVLIAVFTGLLLGSVPVELQEQAKLFAASVWLTALMGFLVWKAFKG